MQFRKHFRKVPNNDVSCIFLHPIGSQPGLITTQTMLSGSGQIAMPSICKADHHRSLKRTAVLKFQPNFYEGLKRNSTNRNVTNSNCLKRHSDAILLPLGRLDCSSRIGFCEPWKLLFSLLIRKHDNLPGPGNLSLIRSSVSQINPALPHVEPRIDLVISNGTVSCPGRVGRLRGDKSYLLKRFTGRAFGGEGNVVDVT